MSSPAATSSTLRPRFAASTTALPGLPGQSGIPEVPISGLPSPPSSPPLAALTSSNELALQPKANKPSSTPISRSRSSRRGGATFQIREECERFFCESMRSVFQGERNPVAHDSLLTGVSTTSSASSYPCLMTPPDDYPTPPNSFDGVRDFACKSPLAVDGWIEFWDYAGHTSFRGFVANDGNEKSIFAFFDNGLLHDGRDLKQALIALIELADGPLESNHVVLCLDRDLPDDDTKLLMRNLQWAGFELTTLDHWAKDVDVTSSQWLFMGMEI